MNVTTTEALLEKLRSLGVETLMPIGAAQFPKDSVLEPPCSSKWMEIYHSVRIGSFSYAVSGYYMAVQMGRYVSIGENVQMGRGDHPTAWLSTSPYFYLEERMFNVGIEFDGAIEYNNYRLEIENAAPLPKLRPIIIGNDVWVGHGAHVRPGVQIGNGAIVASGSIVTRDVPAYAIVAGVPAKIVKYRFARELIQRLDASGWWQLAPWQLRGIDVSRPEVSISAIEKRVRGTPPFQPRKINIADLVEPLPS